MEKSSDEAATTTTPGKLATRAAKKATMAKWREEGEQRSRGAIHWQSQSFRLGDLVLKLIGFGNPSRPDEETTIGEQNSLEISQKFAEIFHCSVSSENPRKFRSARDLRREEDQEKREKEPVGEKQNLY